MTNLPADIKAMDEIIRRRCTIKVLSDTSLPPCELSPEVEQLIEVSGWAPFHRACDSSHREGSDLTGIEPWRYYLLDAKACRQLRDYLPSAISGKIPAMLASADALIIVTWLPNPAANSPASGVQNDQAAVQFGRDNKSEVREFSPDFPPQFEATLSNMEHIAAASAAVQNLLIAATARGIDNYWSIGGVLRCPAAFDLLGIPQREILLGAIFLFPHLAPGAERVGSKLRDNRTTPSKWSRQVTFTAR